MSLSKCIGLRIVISQTYGLIYWSQNYFNLFLRPKNLPQFVKFCRIYLSIFILFSCRCLFSLGKCEIGYSKKTAYMHHKYTIIKQSFVIQIFHFMEYHRIIQPWGVMHRSILYQRTNIYDSHKIEKKQKISIVLIITT